MDNPAEIQEIIQKLQAKGWSVSAIGRAMGVSHITVWRWITGSRHPENAVAVAVTLRRLQRKPVPKRPYRKAS
jgi:DNA invertase Pin-like site-specific DNA recombinase